MTRRDRLEIIHDILSIIRKHGNSILPTPLLRYSNLSTQNFNRYMSELIEKGLVREIQDENGRRYYTLTDKGFKFLEKYQKIREFIEEFGL
ncbi:MAG: winged helix-turn-helix transcriptional regulator [Archaeoglobus sp.]|uniref:archaellum operon transcriptional activator EarA family protein n=1 Tax=Archaeoglobus sp. TaxID=1872626 RepID=UPI001DB56CBC|nr:archaellum operon transcriptional activator EarA family protein [Archaeoglobus sp.]MBO8180138.1 winged helix-turn-helix transcriptional regulator [Archaeoglobus sp.]